MAWTKYNNPNKKRKPKRLSKTDADIIATKNMLIDKSIGYEVPISAYEEQSKRMQGRGK